MPKDVSEPTVDYDHFSEQIARDPFGVWAAMRDDTPCAWSAHYGGFHVVTRHSDVWGIETNPDAFSSAQGISLPPVPFPPGLPLEVDPPAHHGYRVILNPLLAPKAVALFEPTARAFAQKLVSDLPRAGAFDLIEAFAGPYPKLTSIRWMGFPDEDFSTLNRFVTVLTSRGHDDDGTDLVSTGIEMLQYFNGALEAARQGPDKGDLLSALVRASLDDRPLRDDEIVMTLVTVLFGALHTTTLTLTGMTLWLLEHPQERARLLCSPDLIPTAVEEFLRFLTPSNGVIRTAMTDVEVAGCPISAGDKVMVVNGSANHDPREFPQPEQVDLARHPNRHLSFGAGPHRCVGAHLAKLMIRITIEELGPVLEDLQVADRRALRWVGGEGRGLAALPVVRAGS